MKKVNKFFKRLLPVSLAFGIGLATFAGCKDKPEENPTEETGYYDMYTGVDFNTEISKLVENGTTKYKLVIPEKASECEQYAAEEMQKYVKQSTGVTIPIVRDNSGVSLGQELICIGKTTLASSLDATNLNVDGFKMKTDNKTVLIKGERDRGTLYGVYDFLEKFVGTKWFTVDFEYVPEKTEITLYKSDVTEIPDFAMRSRFVQDVKLDLEGGARMRLVSNGNAKGAASAKFGGGHEDDWTNGVHAFNEILDYNVYGKTNANHAVCENPSECTLHTDWYAEPRDSSGEGDPYPQWCLSNGMTDDGKLSDEDGTLVKAAIASLKNIITEQKDALYVGLGQNDNRNMCLCDDCKRQRDLIGGFGAHQVAFCNLVAEELDKWLESEGIDRELKYVTYVYMYTFDAPKMDAPSVGLATPRDNVYLMMCPYHNYYNYPLNDTVNNSDFAINANGWASITKNFMIFDYTTNYTHNLAWYPNFNTIKPNLEWFKGIGVNGITCGASTQQYETRLQTYIFSKMYWHINYDVNALISEFNHYFFGAAGEIMDEFVAFNNTYFETVAREGGNLKAGIYNRAWQTSTSTLNVDYIRQNYRYMDMATQAILSDDTTSQAMKDQYLFNLTNAQVMVDFMKYFNYDALFTTTEADKQAFMRGFYDKLVGLKIDSFGMGWKQTTAELFGEMGIY